MKTDTLAFQFIFQNISYYFWIITWLKNVNNFQIVNVHPRGDAQHLLDKNAADKKKRAFSDYELSGQVSHFEDSNILELDAKKIWKGLKAKVMSDKSEYILQISKFISFGKFFENSFENSLIFDRYK